MEENWKQIALDATEQCKKYEEEISRLHEAVVLRKKASYADPVLLKESVEALVKTGSIKESQFDDSMRILNDDPNASLRVIKALCQANNADTSMKKTESANLEGGTLVTANAPLTDREAAYAEVARKLGINLK